VWSIDQAESLARDVENALRSERQRELLEAIYQGGAIPAWDERLCGMVRLRVIANAFATLRTCTAAGRPCEDYSGPPDEAPPGCLPWFEVPGRSSRSATIVFGHWAGLGFRMEPGVIALDTGCVWGGYLTAVRLDDRAVFHEPAAESN
jgi:bis(5'-nucleosyl)-tetraphosphatase (symmetrical)